MIMTMTMMIRRKPGGERGRLDANCRPGAARSQITPTLKINPHHRDNDDDDNDHDDDNEEGE